MRGHKNISRVFALNTVKQERVGLFDWQQRMGVHLAFHRDPINILLHVVMPPLNALGVFLFLYPFGLLGVSLFGEPVSLAMVAFAVSAAIFLMVDVLAAVLTLLPMALLYPLCGYLYAYLGESALLMMLAGTLVFAIALWAQVAIGHNVCEKGIGDEDENIAELFESKNPVYFLLLPIYPVLDLLFMAGYRKRSATLVWGIMNELRPLVEQRKQQHPETKGI